jgi:CHASE3 domain sensor protein
MNAAQQALAEIAAHERECAIRYENITEAVKAQAKASERLQGWIIATFVTVLLGAFGMIGYLLVNPVVLAHPVPTQQTQVVVKP